MVEAGLRNGEELAVCWALCEDAGRRPQRGGRAGLGSKLGRGVGPVRERRELGWARGKGRNGPAGKGGWIGFGFCFGLVSSFGFSFYFSFSISNSN